MSWFVWLKTRSPSSSGGRCRSYWRTACTWRRIRTASATSAGIAFVFVITMVGLTLIPHLMLEEKQTRTIDVLMISPAGSGSLIAGKAVAGLFYCLLGAGVALIFYRFLIIHWWLAVLATVLGALFTISFGLMLGTIIESRAQLTMWAWVFIMPLFVPVFLSLLEGLVPDRMIEVLRFVPTVVILDLFRTSCAAGIPLGKGLLQLSWVAVWAGGVLVFDGWLVRRQDRQPVKPAAEIEDISATPLLDAGKRWVESLADRFARPQGLPAEGLVGMGSAWVEPREIASGKRDGWRIIWTIASKDITATIKNKLALSIMLGTAFVLATSAVLPLLLRVRNTPAAVVYDPGRSTILRALAASDDLRLGIVDSMDELRGGGQWGRRAAPRPGRARRFRSPGRQRGCSRAGGLCCALGRPRGSRRTGCLFRSTAGELDLGPGADRGFR